MLSLNAVLSSLNAVDPLLNTVGLIVLAVEVTLLQATAKLDFLVRAGGSSGRLGLATPNPYRRGMALPCPALKIPKNVGQSILRG